VTLLRRIEGKILTAGPAHGKKAHLSKDQERDLVSVIKKHATSGTPLYRKNIFNMVTKFCNVNGIPVSKPIGRGWWKGFQHRNPEIIMKVARPLSFARATASNKETLQQFFNVLEITLKENNLLNKPHQIFNVDETGLSTVPNYFRKAVGINGIKSINLVAAEKGSTTTAVICCNAVGKFLPPMLIYKGMRKMPWMDNNLVPCSIVHTSKNGWIDSVWFIFRIF